MKEWLFCFFCEASWTKIVVSFAVSIVWAVVALIRSIRTSSTVWVWISIIQIKNSIFQNSLIFQGLPPVKYPNLMYFPLFLPLPAETREIFYASPTTLSKSLAEVRFASLVEWA